MSARRWLPPFALVAAAALADEPEKPRDLGLRESASTQLAQIDVTVSGPREAIEGLTAPDFEVRVGDKLLPKVFVDALCGGLEAPEPSAPAEEPVAAASRAPASYMIFFDMSHLTQMGRHRAIEAARVMLPKLLDGGSRAMVVSSAAELRTVVPLTTDQGRLDAALATMTNDLRDYDPYGAQEGSRIDQIAFWRKRNPHYAVRLAQQYAQEERQRQERDLSRLRIVLGRLAELDAPKAVLYFADTMRQNAGGHYLGLSSSYTGRPDSSVASAITTAFAQEMDSGAFVVDRVVNEAAASGIRFYTIEAQGLSESSMRVREAQSTLVGMAAETGGRAFLNGVTPGKMTGQILSDLSCVYLLSFDPAGFRQDAPLTVSVKVLRPNVKTTVRGRLVIASESTRRTARILSAYGSPDAEGASARVRVGLFPVGYDKGLFAARVQVAVPASSVPGTTWDVGASLVSSGSVAQDGSGRITLGQAGLPAVWEQDMTFSPGDFQLVAVAHETTTDQIVSKEIRGSWPKLGTDLASFGPIAVSQPASGGFLRNGTMLTRGAVLAGEGDPLRTDAPTALVTLVCRAKDQKHPIRVVRTLHGEGEIPIGTTDVQMGSEERCAQILDLIPAHTLGPGAYRYVIAATSGGVELARAERKMLVPE